MAQRLGRLQARIPRVRLPDVAVVVERSDQWRRAGIVGADDVELALPKVDAMGLEPHHRAKRSGTLRPLEGDQVSLLVQARDEAGIALLQEPENAVPGQVVAAGN